MPSVGYGKAVAVPAVFYQEFRTAVLLGENFQDLAAGNLNNGLEKIVYIRLTGGGRGAGGVLPSTGLA